MHLAQLSMPGRAERLEDRAVQDVSADRDGRIEAEQEDEDRRHQRSTAHPGQTDERADQQTGHRELPRHPRDRTR
jgi:hypothetical protein